MSIRILWAFESHISHGKNKLKSMWQIKNLKCVTSQALKAICKKKKHASISSDSPLAQSSWTATTKYTNSKCLFKYFELLSVELFMGFFSRWSKNLLLPDAYVFFCFCFCFSLLFCSLYTRTVYWMVQYIVIAIAVKWKRNVYRICWVLRFILNVFIQLRCRRVKWETRISTLWWNSFDCDAERWNHH